jgi:hypothetical protein
MTLGTMTLSIMTLIMTLSIMTLSTMTLSTMTISIMTLSIMTHIITTLTIIAEYCMLSVAFKTFNLSVVMQSVVFYGLTSFMVLVRDCDEKDNLGKYD